MVFRHVKPCRSIILASKNEVWQGERAEPENHEKASKMTSTSVLKLMKIDAKTMFEKGDAKMMENGAKMEPKRCELVSHKIAK